MTTSPAYTSLVPFLPVSNVGNSLAFYAQLGFQVRNTHTPEGSKEPVWAWLYCEGAHLMIGLAEEHVEASHASTSFWLYCDDVQATHALLAGRGMDVGEMSYPWHNARGEFHVHDPDGHTFFIAHNGRD